jgi:hypothetical protein
MPKHISRTKWRLSRRAKTVCTFIFSVPWIQTWSRKCSKASKIISFPVDWFVPSSSKKHKTKGNTINVSWESNSKHNCWFQRDTNLYMLYSSLCFLITKITKKRNSVEYYYIYVFSLSQKFNCFLHMCTHNAHIDTYTITVHQNVRFVFFWFYDQRTLIWFYVV